MTISLDQLPAEDFESLVGSVLPVQVGEHALQFEVEAVERSRYPTGRPIPGFSLYLRCAGPAPGQGVVRIQHPAHGELDIFVTPIGRDARGTRYEAVFN